MHPAHEFEQLRFSAFALRARCRFVREDIFEELLEFDLRR